MTPVSFRRPLRSRSVRPAAPPPLERRLTLAGWFADEMGYASAGEMLSDLRESDEDWGGGLHPVLRRAASRGKVKISRDALAEMDDNIRADLAWINRRRSAPVTLKYFQYLAALATENFLRRLCAERGKLRADLRAFAGRNKDCAAPEETDDLNRLALWVATGGGKTLLTHLNYRQFLRRRGGLFSPDNVVLLTPNETLSAQHLEEMRLSGVPCLRHGERSGGLGLEGDYPVQVLEITKLTGGERGAVTVPTEAFEGPNLVFVDEGHKGAGGEAWFQRRDELLQGASRSRAGFCFEYSATFGQALAVAQKRMDEYARAIVFDYSYRHFHRDGYGKDFDVANLGGKRDAPEPEPEKQDALMLGNLLVFLQQRQCFAENREQFSRHNAESPLLLMLGATVTGGQGRTDMAKFMGFLSRVSANRDRDDRPWLEAAAGRILRGESGILDDDRRDVFANRLGWLNDRFGGRGEDAKAEEVCRALLKHVFNANGPGALQFGAIRGTAGQAVMRASGGEHFGLMYVGKGSVSPLLEMLANDAEYKGAKAEESFSSGPVFGEVSRPDSPVNILIGAKKFMEGWSSWRVSGMGLLRVGATEGPLVIQLFGRGVRLKGAGMSLKRGGGGNPPPHLQLLETMNIFGVRANFIANFRKYLEREGVLEEVIRLPMSAPRREVAAGGLLVPEYPEDGFADAVLLAPDKNICAVLDLSSSALRIASAEEGDDETGPTDAPVEEPFPESAAACVDWDATRRRLLEYRVRAEMWNLVFPLKNLPTVLRECCRVRRDADSPLEPTSRRNIRRIRDAAFSALRKYADKFYAARRGEWERKNIRYAPLTEKHPNFPPRDSGYTLRVPKDIVQFADKIRRLVADKKKLAAMWESDENGEPPRIHFCRHLYQPLLLADALLNKSKDIRVSPPGLNTGEERFVRDLRAHLKNNPPKDGEVFLLRNQSRAGLGFHDELGGVYPDFILWIKRGKGQRIVFIEPHGMTLALSYKNDPRAKLHEKLRKDSKRLASRPKWENIRMDSFIVSQTKFADLRKRYDTGDWTEEKFRERHILFPDDPDYIAAILRE